MCKPHKDERGKNSPKALAAKERRKLEQDEVQDDG
jgi:hypothetical protein